MRATATDKPFLFRLPLHKLWRFPDINQSCFATTSKKKSQQFEPAKDFILDLILIDPTALVTLWNDKKIFQQSIMNLELVKANQLIFADLVNEMKIIFIGSRLD